MICTFQWILVSDSLQYKHQPEPGLPGWPSIRDKEHKRWKWSVTNSVTINTWGHGNIRSRRINVWKLDQVIKLQGELSSVTRAWCEINCCVINTVINHSGNSHLWQQKPWLHGRSRNCICFKFFFLNFVLRNQNNCGYATRILLN
jgi:hypothetical protein